MHKSDHSCRLRLIMDGMVAILRPHEEGPRGGGVEQGVVQCECCMVVMDMRNLRRGDGFASCAFTCIV